MRSTRMNLNQNARYFFCGIGGSGMLPLAMILRGKGYHVEGSDRALDQGRLAQKFEHLQAMGIKLHRQDGSGLTSRDQILVTSAAVEDSVPDVQAAKRLDAPTVRRAQLLAEMFNSSDVRVAVGGTSGKSTTTGMVGWILEKSGRAPTIMNGAVMKNFVSPSNPFASAAVGSGGVFVSEVDESDGSIDLYDPSVAIVTNVTLDHKPMDELRRLFGDFVARSGHAVLNLDNDDARALVERARAATTFSLTDIRADLFAGRIKPRPFGSHFELTDRRSGKRCEADIQLPGTHNIANALAALGAAMACGVSVEEAVEGLRSYAGIKRRFELIGEAHGITVIDDFAHNPDKITATIRTLHQFPGRLLMFFQPHGYGPLRLMKRELIECFVQEMAEDDFLLMPDPTYFGGTTDKSVGSAEIVQGISDQGKRAQYLPSRDACGDRLFSLAQSGDRVVIMGARDDTLSDFAQSVFERIKR